MIACPTCGDGHLYYDPKAQAWRCSHCPVTIPRMTVRLT